MLARIHVVLGDGPEMMARQPTVQIGMTNEEAAAQGVSTRTGLRHQLLGALGSTMQGPNAQAILAELQNNVVSMDENTFRFRVRDMTIAHRTFVKQHFESITRQYDSAFIAAGIEAPQSHSSNNLLVTLEFMADSMGMTVAERARLKAIKLPGPDASYLQRMATVLREVRHIVGKPRLDAFITRISPPGHRFSTNLFTNKHMTEAERDEAMALLAFGQTEFRQFPRG